MAKIYYGNQEIGAEQYIDSEHLNNGAVTTSKIADGAVTDTKLDPSIMSEISEISGKQDELVSGENIKTINGESVLGSGDLSVTTYQTFNPNWKTNGTTKEFCDDVNADVSAVVGMAYLGGVTFSDFPAIGLMNADVVVDIIATTAGNKVIRLTLTSGSVAPYHWEYTYWNNGNDVSGWKSWQIPLIAGNNITISNSGRISAADTTYTAGTGLSLDGTEFSVDTSVIATQSDLQGKQDVLTAGANITIDSNNEISATDTTYTAGTGLSLKGTEFNIDTTVVATQNDLTGKQDVLTAGNNIEINNNVISATDSTYAAGNGLSLSGDEFSIDTSVVATQQDLSGKQDTLVSGTNIKTINNESILGSGNIQIEGVTDYDDLDNKPIINQETVYTIHAYTDQEQIHQGDAIHFDRSKAAELLEMLENTVDSSNYSVVLMSAEMSTNPNEHLTFEAIFDQYDNDAYKFMIRTPYQGFTIYNSNSGGFQSNVDVHGDFYLPTDSSSYYYTVDGASIVTTSPDWNGNFVGTATISYSPQPEDGKYYKHDNNIYKYENNRYSLIILNQGKSVGKDSIALTKASITLGDGSISVGPNLIPADDDSYGSLSGSGTTYVITASYSNPISDVAVGDYLYVKDTGDYAKVLTRTSQSMGWYAEVTVTVDKTLGTNPQNVHYFKSTAGAYGFSEGCSGASGSYSHAEGYKTIAIGSDSHSEGEQTKAVGADSHAEGQYTNSVGLASHTEGYYGLSSGNYSHSEGQNTIAKGIGSHSEGGYSIASGECSHSEGMSVDQFSMQVTKTGATFNVSSSDLTILDVGTKFIVPTYRNSSDICPLFYVESKTSNSITIASADEFQAGWRLNEAYSSSQWLGCVLQHEASGKASHVEGENNIASGEASHVEGKHNEAKAVSQHVFGEYNISDVTTDPLSRGTGYGNYIEIVGNGTSSARSNARTLDWSGNEYITGSMKINHTTLVNQSNSDITVNLPSTNGTLTTDEQLATVAKTGNYNDLTNTPTPYAPVNGINFVSTGELQDYNGDSHSSDCTLRFARANDSIHLTGRFTASNITAGTTYHIAYVYAGSGADIPIYDSNKSIQILANWGSQIKTDTDYLCTAYNFTTNDPVGYIFHDGQWLYFLASTTISSSSMVYFSTSYLRKYN